MTGNSDAAELERRVVAAQDGDDDAFAWLVERCSRLAFATAYGWLGDVARSEEAVQEAFARAHRDLRDLRVPAAFPGWLRRITAACCDRMTRRKSLPRAPLESAVGIGTTAGDPSATVEDADERERVRAAVEALPPELRLPIVLHYLDDLSVAEIAAAIAVPESTVKGRLQSAKARLRSSFDALVRDTLRATVRDALPVATPATRVFLAIRAGDAALVARLLDADPALVDATEDWSPELALSGRLPFPNHGTPLLRAVGRGDRTMARLLIERGAPLDRPCACAVGETPLWAAVVSGDLPMAEILLDAGADPDRPAAHGRTPLQVAELRGDAAVIGLLRARGAVADAGGTPSSSTQEGPDRDGSGRRRSDLLTTGIRILDLLAPIERGMPVLWEGRAYVGQIALLAEVSHNLARRDGCRAIWTGIAQGGIDRGDLIGELAETGIGDDVLLLVSATKEASGVRAAVEDALAVATRLRAGGEDVVMILFTESGTESCADLVIGRCAADARSSLSAIVVTSWVVDDGSRRLDPRAFRGCIALDVGLGARGIYPAIDVARTETTALGGKHVTPEHRALARAMRDAFASSDHRGDADAAADPLVAFLAQHFHTRQPVDAEPGEHSSLDETLAAARRALS